MYGLSESLEGVFSNQCTKQNVRCTECKKLYYRCYVHAQCPNCRGKEFVSVPQWYGMPIPGDNNIQGKVLKDGRKIIPKFFMEVRAFVNPQDDDLSSWTSAEEYFRTHGGWEWVEDEEWYSYNRRSEKWDWKKRKIISLTFAKEESD